MRHLTLTYANRTKRHHHHQAPRLLPILLLLREHHEQICTQPDLKLSDLLQTLLAKYLQPPTNWFENKLMDDDCLVMLDGLDEVANTNQRQRVGQWVNQQMSHYPRAQFILTSRPHGYFDHPLERVNVVLAVQPFNTQEIGQFLENWYLQNEIKRRLGRDDPAVRGKAQNLAVDLKKRIVDHAALAAMAINPLLLTMIAIVHDNRGALPGRRVELYAEICDVLLGRRQEAKGLAAPLSAVQRRRVLQALAFALMEANTRSCSLPDGGRYIQDRLGRVAGPIENAENFLRDVENLSGLLVQREFGVYEFVHKSFQEYLAAVEVKEANLGDYLLDKLTDPWWEETIHLYAVQAGDISSLLKTVLTNPTIVGLSLVYNCLEEGAEVSLDLRQKLLGRVEAGLESPDPEVARLAAEVKLSQRLKRLVRLDDHHAIDPEYVIPFLYRFY